MSTSRVVRTTKTASFAAAATTQKEFPRSESMITKGNTAAILEAKAPRGTGSSQQRLSVPPDESPHISSRSSLKAQKRVICPICSESIEDKVGKRKGHDAIFCDGACQEWLHRLCAGLSKASFEAASASNLPFLCPRCLLSQQATELSVLKKNVEELSREVANLKEQVSSIKTCDSQTSSTNCSASQNSLDPLAGKQPQFSSTSRFLQSSGKHLQGHPYNSHSKKFNLVFFGIAEFPSGTKYHSRLRNDHAAITSVLDSLDESLSSVSVHDCVRLGKFSKNYVRPRPLLVKFNSAKDVNTILSKKFKLFSSESHSINLSPSSVTSPKRNVM